MNGCKSISIACEKNHVGPMAQDFHAAFGLDGDDDTRINLTDIAGVSLAAIQELSIEMKQKDAQLAVKDSEIAALKQELSAQTRDIARMKSMSERVVTRLAALEQQRVTALEQQRAGGGAQTVSSMGEVSTRGD